MRQRRCDGGGGGGAVHGRCRRRVRVMMMVRRVVLAVALRCGVRSHRRQLPLLLQLQHLLPNELLLLILMLLLLL